LFRNHFYNFTENFAVSETAGNVPELWVYFSKYLENVTEMPS